jgi:hypothetical protein
MSSLLLKILSISDRAFKLPTARQTDRQIDRKFEISVGYRFLFLTNTHKKQSVGFLPFVFLWRIPTAHFPGGRYTNQSICASFCTVASKELFSRFLCPLNNPERVQINTHLCIKGMFTFDYRHSPTYVSKYLRNTSVLYPSTEYTRGGAVGWGTALQAGRLQVRFPMLSLPVSACRQHRWCFIPQAVNTV